MRFLEYDSQSQIKELINYHNENSEYVTLDTETTGLDPFNDSITDIVVSGHHESEVITFSVKYIDLLRSLRRPILAHNFKFDFRMCLRHGVDLRVSGLFADTMLLDHLLDENQEHSLDAIVKRRYSDPYKEIFWSNYETFQKAPKEEQLIYSCKDVYYTRRIYHDISSELKRENIPKSLTKHVHNLALSLYDTEVEGICLDVNRLNDLSRQLTEQISLLRTKLSQTVAYDISVIELELFEKELDKRKTLKGKNNVKRPVFDWDSALQVGKLLYDQLGLPEQLNQKSKNRTVDDGSLQLLENRHSIIPKLRKYREYQKIYTAFIDGSIKRMRRGKIYPSFNINGTVTGRTSSSDPNLQQLPREGGIRAIYIPREGYSFITCDYSQLEVTLAAHFSRDENLLRIVYDGASQHDITANGLSIPRQTAKTINFAMQYGAGAYKISNVLGCSVKEAELIYNKYWETYKGLHRFILECHAKVENGESLINPFGRRRRFPSHFNTKWELERAKRQAANSLIQGTGADITNRAFYLVDQKLKNTNSDISGRSLFPVHDEVLIEVPESQSSYWDNILQQTMVNIGKEINLSVPLKVESSGPMKCWQD